MCFKRRVQLLAPKELYVRYNAHMMNKPWHPRNTKFGSSWLHKYNTNTYFVKCIFPNPAPEVKRQKGSLEQSVANIFEY